MQDVILVIVYFVGLLCLCALIRYRDEDDAAYFFASIWPLMLISVPFFVVGWIGVKVGGAVKQWRHGC